MKKEELWLILVSGASGLTLRSIFVRATKSAALTEYARVRGGYGSSVTVELTLIGTAMKSTRGTRKLRTKT